MPTIYTTTTWKFYTYSEKVKVKCSKCGKTITKSVSTEYREDSKPDYEYIEKRKQEILNEEHICSKCLKEAVKGTDKQYGVINIDNEVSDVKKVLQEYKDLGKVLRTKTSIIAEKIKDRVIKHNDDEYVVNYVWNENDYLEFRCSKVSKTQPWNLTNNDISIREDLPKGESGKYWLSLQDVIMTDEVFSERRKRVKEL